MGGMSEPDRKVIGINGQPVEVAGAAIVDPLIVEMCQELLTLAASGLIHRLACVWEGDGDPTPTAWHRGGTTYSLIGMMEVSRLKMAHDLEEITQPEETA